MKTSEATTPLPPLATTTSPYPSPSPLRQWRSAPSRPAGWSPPPTAAPTLPRSQHPPLPQVHEGDGFAGGQGLGFARRRATSWRAWRSSTVTCFCQPTRRWSLLH